MYPSFQISLSRDERKMDPNLSRDEATMGFSLASYHWSVHTGIILPYMKGFMLQAAGYFERGICPNCVIPAAKNALLCYDCNKLGEFYYEGCHARMLPEKDTKSTQDPK